MEVLDCHDNTNYFKLLNEQKTVSSRAQTPEQCHQA